jgi:threonyl-tRNA synthetase
MAVIGKRESEAEQVAVRSRKSGDEGPTAIIDFLARLKSEAVLTETPA